METLTIKKALQGAKQTNYFRTADYNRALALTEFLKELEKQYKNNFKLLGGSIKKLQCRHIDNGSYWKDADIKTEKESFTTYASFIVNGTKYYIQLNENPFFESYICIYSNYDKVRYKNERLLALETLNCGSDTLDTMFKYNGKENINKLKKDLLISFKNIKENNYTTCTLLNDKQTLYY